MEGQQPITNDYDPECRGKDTNKRRQQRQSLKLKSAGRFHCPEVGAGTIELRPTNDQL